MCNIDPSFDPFWLNGNNIHQPDANGEQPEIFGVSKTLQGEVIGSPCLSLSLSLL